MKPSILVPQTLYNTFFNEGFVITYLHMYARYIVSTKRSHLYVIFIHFVIKGQRKTFSVSLSPILWTQWMTVCCKQNSHLTTESFFEIESERWLESWCVSLRSIRLQLSRYNDNVTVLREDWQRSAAGRDTHVGGTGVWHEHVTFTH